MPNKLKIKDLSRSLTGIVIIGLGLLTGYAGSLNSGSNTQQNTSTPNFANTGSNLNPGTNFNNNNNSRKRRQICSSRRKKW